MKYTKHLVLLFKIVLLIASVVFAWYKLTNAGDAHDVITSIPDYWSQNYRLFIVVCGLLFLNWGIEAQKWKFVLRNYYQISFGNAFKSVMSGVSLGLFTPNRIGEFGGRILYLPPKLRKKASLLSMLSSYSQFFTTLLLGIPALLLFVFWGAKPFSEIPVSPIALIAAFFVAAVLMLLYFNLNRLYVLLVRIPLLSKYAEIIAVIKEVPLSDLLRLLILSILRYAVFVLQFYFIASFFNVNIHFYELFVAAANLYFMMSMLPMFTIGEPGLRASLTAVFFSPFTLQISAVISASVLLWIVNVLLVALAGALFLLNQKIVNYEDTSST